MTKPVFSVSALLLWLMLPAEHPRFQACLPEGTKAGDIVSALLIRSGPSGSVVKKTTVEQKLIELKAHCKNGKLVDGGGKEIRFYKLTGCWGNPPVNYQEILEKQRSEIEELKKHYTVIEMTCHPAGPLIQ